MEGGVAIRGPGCIVSIASEACSFRGYTRLFLRSWIKVTGTCATFEDEPPEGCTSEAFPSEKLTADILI